MNDENENNVEMKAPRLFTKLVFMGLHGLCLLVLLLVVLWFGEYDTGYGWGNGDAAVFAWHPTFMVLGLVVCFVEAAISYRAFADLATRPNIKLFHLLMHSMAILFVSLGLIAVFRFHNEHVPPIPNLYSLHSWLGILTVTLFFAQYIGGFYAFLYPKMNIENRAQFVAFHSQAGLLILVIFVSATVCTGVLEKLTFGKDCNLPEGGHNVKCYIGNSLALTVVCINTAVAILLLQPKKSQTNLG